MAAKVHEVDDVLEKFRTKLGSRETIVNELNKYAVPVIKEEEKKPTQIQTTLEVNLMLAFLFLAGLLCKVPILEKDILAGA